MAQSNDWIPTTLFEMAAFCEKNRLEKVRSILLEAAALIYIDFANQRIGEPDSLPSILRPNPLARQAEPIAFLENRRNGTDM